MAILRANFVVHDLQDNTILAQRLENYAARTDNFSILCTDTPAAELDTDCYIVIWNRIAELVRPADRPPRWKPVIAYGPATAIRAAFLEGCADFMKEPWTLEELYFRVLQSCRGRNERFSWGNLELDGLVVRLHLDSPADNNPTTLRLGVRQGALLDALLALRGTVVSRDILFYAMWEQTGDGSRAVDMQIHALRELLGAVLAELGGDLFIRGIYGEGYMIE